MDAIDFSSLGEWLEPLSWVAGVLALLIALPPVFRQLRKSLGKKRDLRKNLSQLPLGTPRKRVYDLLGDPVRAAELSRTSFATSDGRNEFFEFPDVDVQVIFEGDVLEVLSVRTKSSKYPVSLRGRGAVFPYSLSAGTSKFSDIPLREVTHCELVCGARAYMNWYLELRPGRSESDPNVWLYGWRPTGAEEMDQALLPTWFEGAHTMPCEKLTAHQRTELEAFRASLTINSVVALRYESDAKRFHLSGLF